MVSDNCGKRDTYLRTVQKREKINMEKRTEKVQRGNKSAIRV